MTGKSGQFDFPPVAHYISNWFLFVPFDRTGPIQSLSAAVKPAIHSRSTAHSRAGFP